MGSDLGYPDVGETVPTSQWLIETLLSPLLIWTGIAPTCSWGNQDSARGEAYWTVACALLWGQSRAWRGYPETQLAVAACGWGLQRLSSNISLA